MMSDHDEAEAGPSIVPLFKKKKGGAGRISKPISRKNGDDTNQITGEVKDIDAEDDEERVALDDLIALRSMRTKPQGIDLERLNKGELKKKKKKKRKDDDKPDTAKTDEDRWAEQMRKGGLVSRDALQADRASGGNTKKSHSSDDEDGDEKSSAPRLLKENNFQGETGTVDVDKHMMAYIEEEMKKRRQGQRMDAAVEAAINAKDTSNGSFNSAEDELYKVAEKYKAIQQSAKDAIAQAKGNINATSSASKYADAMQALAAPIPDEEKDEGNASLSTSMLTGVPEVDLGMEVRMRNIEATERAKREMEEARARQRNGMVTLEDDADFAAARFFRHNTRVQSDAEQIALEKANEDDQQQQPMAEHRKRPTASDAAAVDRFKKRQRNQLKR
ncbi:uncharacterized protein FA14DRAFT_62942 [Meira miltonrushii]|uniref:Hepatocellular carcinoma-associated antigen 59-domain-containing protein n=1 Tax=Meira miltonrushii TaxID=1280837 RepID=A0A316V7C0_9BASI|nr:uncharacterized protein FA14DRAFT_62942 [Meira miltonrushii]PWN33509.1 hypothetical protein FA14DRAFT_62942 [Meira miltonrushii]